MSDGELFQTISELVEAQAHGTLLPEQARRLETLVKSDPEACRLYVQYINESASLKWWASTPPRLEQIEETPAIDFELVMEYVRADVEDISRRMLAEQQARDKAHHPSYYLSQPQIESPTKRVIVIPKMVFYAGTAAVLALVATVMILATGPASESPPMVSADPPSADDIVAPTPVIVGRVAASVEAGWEIDGQPFNGEFVDLHAEQRITLTAGMAELSFEGGATVILSAPATLVPLSDKRMALENGSIVGHCDRQARGFVVEAGNTYIEDLGTEFAVQRDAGGQADGVEVHVFHGLVRVSPTALDDSQQQADPVDWLVSAGRALHVGPDLRPREFEADASDFVRHEEFDANARAAAGSAYDRWLAYSYRLRRDPRLVAYFTFDNRAEAPGVLLNRAAATSGKYDGRLGGLSDGQTAVPRWTEGRFTEKDALRFGFAEQRVVRTVEVDGLGQRRFGDQLTLAVWLRVPSNHLQTGGGTLLSLRDSPLGRLAFQFSIFLKNDPYARSLQFGTGNELAVDHLNENFRYSKTPHSVEGDRWYLAAVVYDAGTATFYLDGQPMGSDDRLGPLLAATRPETPLLIGIDPGMPGIASHRGEAFMGDIDEVLILERSMTQQELLEMYRAGTPE